MRVGSRGELVGGTPLVRAGLVHALGAGLVGLSLAGCRPEPIAQPGAITAPRPIAPWNGEKTGSALASRPRRPTFRWRPVPEASTYELQVDDSCTTPGFDRCQFPSPELFARDLIGTTHTPSADLPVSLTPPVGRRYYWRLRACVAASCSAWSSVRYVDVGRQQEDLNGDGYADVYIGGYAPDSQRTVVNIFHGDAALDVDPDLVLTGDEAGDGFAARVAVGDLNADGYADLAVGSTPDEGGHKVYLFYGGPRIDTVARHAFEIDGGKERRQLMAISGCGDVNADGYADLLVGVSEPLGVPGTGRVHFFFGGQDFSETAAMIIAGESEDFFFGTTIASRGDLNGDGFSDVVIGAMRATATAEAYSQKAYVHFGAPWPSANAGSIVSGGVGPNYFLVYSGGDLDGDGLGDVVLSAARNGDYTRAGGRVYVHLGDEVPDDVVDEKLGGQLDDFLGLSLESTADLNGDGIDDLALGVGHSPPTIHAPELSGRVEIFFTLGKASPDVVIPDQLYNDVGASFSAGDVNGDGAADLLVGPHLFLGPIRAMPIRAATYGAR